jgi:hypothetical protein
VKYWLVLVVLAACNCHEDRGTPVTPRPAANDATPKTLTVDDYVRVMYAGAPQTTYAATTSSEHEAIAKLVPALLEAAWSATPGSPARWQDTAAAAGFRIDTWTIGGERYWALVEAEGRARGAGAYIFRVAPKDAMPVVLLQAPHELYDLGTGRLAAELMFTPRIGVRPRALFTNTMHRYQLAPGDKKKRKHNPADVAHNPDHAFTVATDAFAIAAGDVRVIQLHGFGARDDDDDDGDASAITAVVSAGDKRGSSPLSNAIAVALARPFGGGVKRYPEDTQVLGATTNVQKRVLDGVRGAAFVHIEMSADLRKQLAASADVRAQLAAAVFDTEPAR